MTRKLIPILVLPLALPTVVAAGGWQKDAIKEMNAAFEGHRFIAKVDLRTYAHYYVHADGTPVEDKKQNKGGKGPTTICCGPDVQVEAGGTGEGIWLFRIKDDQIWMGFKRESKRRINPAMAHILFDRAVTPDDVDPAKLARAVVSLVEIEGFEAGADLERAFDQAIAAGEESASAPRATGPSPALLAVRAWTEPAEVARGGELRLLLEYELGASAGEQQATESLSLLLGEQALPGYPVVSSPMRGAGVHQASYAQRIPSSAVPGTYALRGEVCVAGDCIVRKVALEVK